MDAVLLDLFIAVLAELRRRLANGYTAIYVCDLIDKETYNLDVDAHEKGAALERWHNTAGKFGANFHGLGWWEQTPEGHAQRMLALESIIADLGGDPQ